MFVEPETFCVGSTQINMHGLTTYLQATGQEEFLDDVYDFTGHSGLALCSFYAKLCYRSLTVGKNANVSKTRSIKDNLVSCFSVGHGSVFEHCWINFITTNCSRVFTHELVRHRVGTAFSQTSGRYVALENIDFISDPLLAECHGDIMQLLEQIEDTAQRMRAKLITEEMGFSEKKKITSAIRRIAPNGQANEIGWSVNVRSLRHIVSMRSSKAAEREIRIVANQVFDLVDPLMFHGFLVGPADEDGLREFYDPNPVPFGPKIEFGNVWQVKPLDKPEFEIVGGELHAV